MFAKSLSLSNTNKRSKDSWWNKKKGLFAEVIEIESETGKMRTQVIKWKKEGYQDETGTVDLDKRERKGNHGDKARKIRHTYTEDLEPLTSLVYFWLHVLFLPVLFLPVPGREKTIIKEKEHRGTYRSRYGVANNQKEKERERARQSWPSILTSTHTSYKLWSRFLVLVTLACSHFASL